MSNNLNQKNQPAKNSNFSITYNKDASCMILTWKSPLTKAIGATNQVTRLQYWVTDDFSDLRQGEVKGVAAHLDQLGELGGVNAFLQANSLTGKKPNNKSTHQLSEFLNLKKSLN